MIEMRIAVLAAALLLAGCATPQQRAQEMAAYIEENYGPTCVTLGYKPDTDAYRNCMLSMYNTDQVRNAGWGTPGWGVGWGGRYRR